MLPEERLFRIMQQKQAGIFDLYNQQSNLGGDIFTKDEDPLTALLGKDFNDKYRGDYADTLKDTWTAGNGRLTSRTGARLMNDLNEMNDRGVAALHGLSSNSDKALKFIKSINNSRVGVGGYTQEAADKDYTDIADKINLAARLHRTGDRELFDTVAKKYVRGQLAGAISGMTSGIQSAPGIARPFIDDISDEFHKKPGLPAKVTSTTPSGKVDESRYGAKNDKKELKSKQTGFFEGIKNNTMPFLGKIKDMFGGAGNYMLPALLLGALGGGLNRARGGSFLAPMLLMTLLGGMYGMGRHRGYFNGSTIVEKALDKTNDTMKDYGGRAMNTAKNVGVAAYDKTKQLGSAAYNTAKEYTKPVVNVVSQAVTPMVSSTKRIMSGIFNPTKKAEYTELTVEEFINK